MPITGPRIEVTVDKKGVGTTSVIGIQGGSCHALSEGYENLFGDVIETVDTAEAYEEPEEVEIKSERKD
jgi:hypothetical protein